MIQRTYRSRKTLRETKRAWFLQHEEEEEEKAVISIQNIFRRRLARKILARKQRHNAIKVGLEERVKVSDIYSVLLFFSRQDFN